ncbi:MAG: hypothetical protein ACE5DM_03585 [Candidatus Nanoarchaeia archaeon]
MKYLIPLLIILVALAGCDNVVCDEPYMRHGSDCCLDENKDRVCDEERAVEPAEPVEKVPAVEPEKSVPDVVFEVPVDEPEYPKPKPALTPDKVYEDNVKVVNWSAVSPKLKYRIYDLQLEEDGRDIHIGTFRINITNIGYDRFTPKVIVFVRDVNSKESDRYFTGRDWPRLSPGESVELELDLNHDTYQHPDHLKVFTFEVRAVEDRTHKLGLTEQIDLMDYLK